ncbi:YkgJ family cysteine cluster protein [Arsukibacterium indicum]|uniref:YkgJ family cysteine cluster protein n=1 Tax=Arsukibacterium indicum TaxID=2848612 RepID=A0ABS6MK03_9GAMM|nr:YkgJ family cysteine cluster protein [Arsukibacterium indicum]MBV2129148.1 YkgJ family cysteine cluster protein [Arsukibacterium indicum]
MQRLRELSRRVEAVYSEIADTFSNYQQRQGLQCRTGCGECCLAPTIEATTLEMLPLALHLFDIGRAEQTLEQLDQLTEPQGCLFYQKLSFDGKQGQCSVYQQRPSICRMFGAAGYRDKTGQTSLSVCKTIKADHPAKYQQGLIMLQSSLPPLMMQSKEQVNELDYQLGNRHYPINTALQLALEQVMFKACYSFEQSDQQIA